MKRRWNTWRGEDENNNGYGIEDINENDNGEDVGNISEDGGNDEDNDNDVDENQVHYKNENDHKGTLDDEEFCWGTEGYQGLG